MPVTTTLTFGDLIKQHRTNAGLSLSELADLAAINKGTISKIENGRNPEFRTLKPIAEALQIPYETYLIPFIEQGQRPHVLNDILKDAIEDKRPTYLITKIAEKFLESEKLDSYEATSQLFDSTYALENPELKLALFKTIILYSRGHGVMPFLARSLFQEYLIERNNFSKLQETYPAGKYVLKYRDALPAGEYARLLYCLAGHAYVIRQYSESVEYCKAFLKTDEQETGQLRVYAVDILRGAYYHLGEYDLVEKYTEEYRRCAPSIEADNDRLLSAMLNAKKGNDDLAIELFEKSLRLCDDDFIVHAVNEYIAFCFERDHIDKMENLILSYETKIHEQTYITPRERSEVGRFYMLKGDYYTRVNSINRAISNYIEAAYSYACIADLDNERECLRQVFSAGNQHSLAADVVKLIGNYYNRFKKEQEGHHEE
ncbi:helix-turn-helix domain-containing protein [Paenibacillus agilis]|nr:helix-turn-helix transcriptional regulator [Paenibacillus agilis]